jgi:hypothetical protein
MNGPELSIEDKQEAFLTRFGEVELLPELTLQIVDYLRLLKEFGPSAAVTNTYLQSGSSRIYLRSLHGRYGDDDVTELHIHTIEFHKKPKGCRWVDLLSDLIVREMPHDALVLNEIGTGPSWDYLFSSIRYAHLGEGRFIRFKPGSESVRIRRVRLREQATIVLGNGPKYVERWFPPDANQPVGDDLEKRTREAFKQLREKGLGDQRM